MDIHIRGFSQPTFYLITGSVKSGKSAELISLINSYKGSDGNLDDWLLVVKHPYDDKESRLKISSFKETSAYANECKDADEIADLVNENTKYLVISGIHLYNKKIVDLCDALIMGGRTVIASGINLRFDGKTYGQMDNLMAIADSYEITKARCSFCGENNAYRTQKFFEENNKIFKPRCLIHYNPYNKLKFNYNPFLIEQEPSLEVIVGPMFSGKTNLYHARYYQIENEEEVVSFKWIKDNRYSNNNVFSHDNDTVPSKNIKNANEINKYLEKNEKIKTVMIDEAQFLKGVGTVVEKLLCRGYNIIVNGLKRDFRRKPFGEMPRILTLATIIHNKYASCYIDGLPATETQRIITENGKDRPASLDDSVVLVGGKKNENKRESYEPVCRKHYKILNPKGEVSNLEGNRYFNSFNIIQ